VGRSGQLFTPLNLTKNYGYLV